MPFEVFLIPGILFGLIGFLVGLKKERNAKYIENGKP